MRDYDICSGSSYEEAVKFLSMLSLIIKKYLPFFCLLLLTLFFLSFTSPPLNAGDIKEWTVRPSHTSHLLNGIAFGNNTFVAVGENSHIIISQEGNLWTPVTSETSLHIKGVVYGGGKFVAVGTIMKIIISRWGFNLSKGQHNKDSETIATPYSMVLSSVNGNEWISSYPGMTNILYDLAHGDGLFVAVGRNGSITKSHDGINWMPVESYFDGTLYGIAYGNGIFVAVGVGGAILTSTDAVNWVIQLSATRNTLYGIAFGIDRFVSAGANNTIISSPDGAEWSLRETGLSQTVETKFYDHTFIKVPRNLYGVGFGGKYFVVVGGSGTILTSVNGVIWSNRVSPLSTALNSVAFGNDRFVAVGLNGAIVQSGNVERIPAITDWGILFLSVLIIVFGARKVRGHGSS